MNGAASAQKDASPRPTKTRQAKNAAYVVAVAHPAAASVQPARPSPMSLNGFQVFAAALNAGAPMSRPSMNAACSSPNSAYPTPNSPCRPLPGSPAPTRGDPLTAALLMTPRSTYTSSDMRQNSDSRQGG